MIRKSIIILVLLLSFFPIIIPAHALVVSSDPFDETDHYAILLPTPDGAITQIQAKVKAPDQVSIGAGEIWALARYKLPPAEGGRSFYFSVSHPVSIEGLDPVFPALISFDFSEEPVPVNAYYRTLTVYYQDDPANEPLLITEYTPEQLILRPSGDTIQTDLELPDSAVSGELVLGPFTVIREKGIPQTDSIPFTVSDATGPFFLRIINGTDDGTHRVSSAVIRLNGQDILRPSELNQQVSGLNRQIVLLQGENLLDVRLRSVPGSSITIEIYRQSGNICRAFGPHTFIRATGKPIMENVTFPLNPRLTGPFTLNVTSGDTSGANRVDSASVTLNSQVVFYSSQFNEQVSGLSSTVSPQAANTVGVEINGSPGDRLSLEMTGFDNTPPQVVITSPTHGTTFSMSPITVTGTVDDPSASVTVNEIAAVVASDGTFTVDGLMLQEGENTLTVTATDPCENKSQNVITVYLQTIPSGPEIILCAEPFVEQMPHPPGEVCSDQAYGRWYGFVTGMVDESAISLSLNGVPLPPEELIYDTGVVFYGMWEEDFLWSVLSLPSVDGIHPYTAVATDAEGNQRSATVSFIRDTVKPRITITSPPYGAILNTLTVTIHGTVDDPEAVLRLGSTGRVIPNINGNFEVDVTLREGINYITITARDPAFNSGYVNHLITLDTVLPQLNITSPVEGLVINTLNLSVSGTVTDTNKGTVTVSVNNGLPLNLTVVGTTFSGIVSLSSGLNTLVFEATDKAGNRTTATRSVLVDLDPPAVSITSPASGAQVSGVITVTADASDSQSGISNVSLLVDGVLYRTTSMFPYTFEIDTMANAAGVHTITVRAVDSAGNVAETSVSMNVLPQVQVQIISPVDGATVTQSPALVKGRIVHNLPEVGVVVNGVIAQVYGDEFAAEIYLVEGVNTITVTATNGSGLELTTSIGVTLAQQLSPVTITAIPSSGIQPLNVTFEVETSITNPVVNYQWDTDGNGTVDQSGANLSTITVVYQNPGFYFPKVIVTDTLGNRFEETTVIHVLSTTDMDAFLRRKWTSMIDTLNSGDTIAALTYIFSGSQTTYQTLFNVLSGQLLSIVATQREFNLIDIMDNVARYKLLTIESGKTYSYEVIFIKDNNGIWKIKEF